MDAMVSVINSMVSISDFNKGEAGRIFGSIKKTNQPKLVLRRNEPECVLLSPNSYIAMMEELEDLRDFKLAVERIAKSDEKTITRSDALKLLKLSESDISAAGDVEFE